MPPLVESAIGPQEIHGIGLVTAEWSYAETMIEGLIWRLAGLDTRKGQILTTHVGSIARLHMITALAEEILDEVSQVDLRNEIMDLVALFEDLRVKRNAIVHAHWIYQSAPDPEWKSKAMTVTAKGKLIVQEQTFDPLHSRNVAKQITSWVWMASEVSKKLPPQPAVEARRLAQLVRRVGQSPDPNRTGVQPPEPSRKK